MKVPADILALCSSVVCLRKIYHYSICIWHVSTVLKLANFPKHKNGFLSYHMNHISQKQTRFCYGFFPPFQNALSLSNPLPNPFHSLHLWDTFKETKQRAKKISYSAIIWKEIQFITKPTTPRRLDCWWIFRVINKYSICMLLCTGSLR